MRPYSAAVVVLTLSAAAPSAGVLAAGALSAQERVDLPAQDRRLDPDLEEVYRVGAFDGEAWETFGEIRGVAFDGSGNLYVFDAQSSQVVVIDRAGRYVRTIGSPGEGPGELRSPMSLVVMRDGQVVVADMGHRAYVLYGPDGAYQRMVSMGTDGTLRIGELIADPLGGALISGGSGHVMAFSARGGHGEAPPPPSMRPIERISLSGATAASDTLVEAWLPPQDADPAEVQGPGVRLSMRSSRTFEPALLVGALPDGGVAFSDSSAYSIEVADAQGRVARVIRRPFRPRPVTEEIQEAERERRLQELEAGGGPQVTMMMRSGAGAAPRQVAPEQIREMMRGQVAQMRFYHELPVLMDVATGWDGKIWVLRRGEGPRDEGPVDVLTSTGLYAGTFAAGEMSIPDAFGPDGLAAFVETDELEVPVVVVRRLPELLR